MTSRSPFNFTDSKLVAPIMCISCGNNAYCVRRVPQGTSELQTFLCAACGNETTELRGVEASDYQIEKEAERLAGVSDGVEKNLDGSRRRASYRSWLEGKFAKTERAVKADKRGDKDAGGPVADSCPEG
jgi:hypothetical protein